MKSFLFIVVTVLLIVSVRCQDEEGGGRDTLWGKLKNMMKEFMNSMRDIWNQMKTEIKARTEDMSGWTREMFNSFKDKMNEWINQASTVSESEKEKMKIYVERLEMKPDEK